MWKRRLILALGLAFNSAALFSVVRFGPAVIIDHTRTQSPPVRIGRIFEKEDLRENSTPTANVQLAPIRQFDNAPFEKRGVSSPPMTFALKAMPRDFRYSWNTFVGDRAAIGQLMSPNTSSGVTSFSSMLASKEPTNVRIETDLPSITIDIPTEMKVTEDSHVTAQLNLQASSPTEAMKVPPHLTGATAAFDIAGPSQPTDLSWNWDVLAKSVGDRRTLTLQFPSNTKFDFKFDSDDVGRKVRVMGNVITAFVDVRDELGLTAPERTIFTAAGAVISVLGTIFAFPFIKSRLEPKPSALIQIPASVKKRKKRRQH